MSGVIVHNLSKVYGKGENAITVLKNASINVNEGELVSLMGPSGSGKTTLLTSIGLINEPSNGFIQIAGKKVYENKWLIRDLSLFRRNMIGFIFQHHNLLPFLNAYDNVNLMLKINGIKGLRAKEKIHEIFEYLDITNTLYKFPYMLSGGQSQRIAIARAVVSNPKLILADEPTAALDTERGLKVMSLLKKIALEKNTSIIVVTHDKRMLEGFDKIFHLKDGKLV